jgi:hypothetical protein
MNELAPFGISSTLIGQRDEDHGLENSIEKGVLWKNRKGVF